MAYSETDATVEVQCKTAFGVERETLTYLLAPVTMMMGRGAGMFEEVVERVAQRGGQVFKVIGSRLGLIRT